MIHRASLLKQQLIAAIHDLVFRLPSKRTVPMHFSKPTITTANDFLPQDEEDCSIYEITGKCSAFKAAPGSRGLLQVSHNDVTCQAAYNVSRFIDGTEV